MAINWVSGVIRRKTHRKTFQQRETEIGNCQVTAQSICTCAKYIMNRDESKTPTDINSPFGLTYHPTGKANEIVDCLENQFTTLAP
jgi:hypothetical protein